MINIKQRGLKKTHQWIRMAVPLLLAAALGVMPRQSNAEWRSDEKLPVSVQVLLREVRLLMHQNAYQQAINTIRDFEAGKSRETDDAPCQHPLVCFALGNCHLLLEDYPKAETAYLKTLQGAPDFIDARVNLAKVYSETKQYKAAADCFLQAYAGSAPIKPEYLYYYAVTCLMDGKNHEAIDGFERLFAAHPRQVEFTWRENYVYALLATGQTLPALPVIRQLITEAEGSTRIKWQEMLLHSYLQLEMSSEALALATELTRSDCTTAKWWKARAHIYLSRGQYKPALADLTIYGYLTPLTAEEKKLWADLSLQLDIADQATLVYESLLNNALNHSEKEKPQPDKELLQHLVMAYRRLGMDEKGIELLDHFDLKNADHQLLMLKGDLLYALKRYGDAKNAYRRAAACAASDQAGQAWLLAGYAAWQIQDLNSGLEAFRQAAKFRRQRKDALTAIVQLTKIKRQSQPRQG